MKRMARAAGRSTSKTKAPPKDVDDYLLRVPEPARKNFNLLRATIRSAAPRDAMETISYGIPAIKHKKVLVWFAAFSNHCSIFPTARVIAAFQHELKGFSTSKGTVHFSNDRRLPASLVRKLVKARVAQAET